MTTKSYIRGFGFYAPENILTNADLEKVVDTTDEWITSRTGIKQRHIISEGQTTSDLAAKACEAALNDADMDKEKISHVILATCTPDSYCPSAACLTEHKLGLKGRMALDINAVCSGFLYGLELADSIAKTKPDAAILLAGGECMSTRINYEDRNTCVLFGDGSGATVISSEKGEDGVEIVDIELSSDGSLADLLTITGGGSAIPYKLGDTVPAEHFVMMQGRDVFKNAVRSMSNVCQTVIERNNLTIDDIDLLIPHQANIRIIEAVGKKVDIPTEKVFINVHEFGNTSAASVPIALADAKAKGVLKPGMTVLLTTFGGGFTWGAALLKF